LGIADDSGVSETDVKLLPQYWGKGYGTEIKRALVDWLFTNTDCRIIRATPNRNNIPSQKMQEAVGGRRVGEGVCEFPESMRDHTVDVPYYIYEVTRKTWERRKA
jgi:RimJ/RimL family protein N-acetyltransferase